MIDVVGGLSHRGACWDVLASPRVLGGRLLRRYVKHSPHVSSGICFLLYSCVRLPLLSDVLLEITNISEISGMSQRSGIFQMLCCQG